ncbi:MAG: hypothetical protein ICV51_05530, partial [Flavisolibacter sp.]|nr:hypothetical protein [Flavisolibacter sp.]
MFNRYKKIIKPVGFLLLLLTMFQHGYSQIPEFELEYAAKIRRLDMIRMEPFWSYQPDDDTAFAQPYYIDAQWPKVYPLTLTDATGKMLPWKGIGWFRQRLIVP